MLIYKKICMKMNTTLPDDKREIISKKLRDVNLFLIKSLDRLFDNVINDSPNLR